jgi:uncharacterized membrane-anchored protein YjiN (DUF445 family)
MHVVRERRRPAAAAPALPREPGDRCSGCSRPSPRRHAADAGRRPARRGRAGPDHPARRWLDGLLAPLADDLRYDAETARRVDARLRALVEDPHLQSLLHAVLLDLAASVRTSLDDLDGGLQARLTSLVQDAARRVLHDPALQRRLDERLAAAVRYAVQHYGDAVVVLISRTVRGWDARDASARIEAAVGRDLQYIRINGTVVGALAGVVLHAVEVLVG